MSAKQEFVLPINGSDYRFTRSLEIATGKLVYSISDSNNPFKGIFQFEQDDNGKWASNGIEDNILRAEVLRRIIINEIS